MNELIRKQIAELKGKKIKVFFKYANVDYNIKKSGIVLDSDDKFFILDEIKDGHSTYSYDFITAVLEEKE